MKTHIAENIAFLVKKVGCSQDEFGAMFGLKKNVINNYIVGSGSPKLLTVIKICAHFKIAIDDFVYKPLENTPSEPDSDLLKKQSQLIVSLEEEVEKLNLQIIKMRS